MLMDFISLETTTYCPDRVRSFVGGLTGHHVEDTGEVLPYANREHRHLHFRLNERRGTLGIRGSIHRYWQGSNVERFDYFQFVSAVNQLCMGIGTAPGNLAVHSFEFGVNLPTTVPASEIIGNLSHFKNPVTRFERIKNERAKSGEVGRVIGKVHETTEWDLKVYDKGRQYGITANLLRVEIKVKRMRCLAKWGMQVDTLADLLNPCLWQKLGGELLSRFDETRFINKPVAGMKIEDAKLMLASEPYWKWVKENHLSTYKKELTRLKELEESHPHAQPFKKELREAISKEVGLMAFPELDSPARPQSDLCPQPTATKKSPKSHQCIV